MSLQGLPESFPCGTRSAYVRGCRCDACRASNNAYYHDRQRRAREAAAARPVVDGGPREQQWTAPDGTKKTRTYQRACPGLGGRACRLGSHLRKDSKGGVCRHCREQLVWNGLVDAEPVRRRLAYWSDFYGLGYKAAADAAGVARSVVAKIMSGQRKLIRRDTYDKLLAITPDAIADHAIIDGAKTWEHIRFMLRRGLTKAEIARRLGNATPALQIRKRVLAITALKVARLREKVEEEERKTLVLGRGGMRCPECESDHSAPARRALIQRMLPAELDEIVECWPCLYEDTPAGRRLLKQDLRDLQR